MKKGRIVLITLGILAAGAVCSFAVLASGAQVALSEPVGEPDLSQIPDGTYEGSYSAGPVFVRVLVTTKDHKIADVDVLEHRNGQGAPAESIARNIVDAQHLGVDAVTGATISSKAIELACQDALARAS